jgi:DNA replication protein DnaC
MPEIFTARVNCSEYDWKTDIGPEVRSLFPAPFRDALKEGVAISQQHYSYLTAFAENSRGPTGQGIYFYGKAGRGKTFQVCAMTYESIKARCLTPPGEPPAVPHKTYNFVSVPDLLAEIRESFRPGNTGQSEMDIIKKYRDCDWCVLDDIGAEKPTEWALATLYVIINGRYERGLTTIFTSNCSLDELAEHLGSDRIPSRIMGMCSQVKVGGDDRRKK